jgi:chromosome segregation ATPase
MKLIDDMVGNLKKEQTDDEAKKAFCGDEINQTEDKQREITNKLHGIEAHIEVDENDIDSTTAEIKAVKEGIKDLDKSVAEATQQRKAEHEAYIETAAQNNAALELLEFAKNRLNKVYNPQQYKEESFIQITAHVQGRDEPPAAFGEQKKQNSGGVLGMLDKLRNDLKLEMNEDKLEENDAQGDYEKLMADSAAKRSTDSKALTEKEAAVADATADLTDTKSHHKEVITEGQETDRYMSNLHATCDWLMQNFDTRKQARTEEIESLQKAKAVLAGADYSL